MKKLMFALSFLISLAIQAQTKHTINPYGNVNGAVYELEENNYQARPITYYPASSVWSPAYGWPQTTVNPGDTIELNAAYYFGRVTIIGVAGTAANRVVVISSDSTLDVLDRGITFIDCSYLTVIGLRQKTRTFRGIAYEVIGRSEKIDFIRCHSDSSWYWNHVKQDPTCDANYNFPAFVMDSIRFLHCRVNDVMQDGAYLGNTSQIPGPTYTFANGERYILCAGDTSWALPLAISNIEVAYCTLTGFGRTAIQVGGHRSGICKIHHNYIRGTGYELDQNQGTAVSIGGMSRNVHVTDNYIRETFIYSIFDLGVDTNYIERNDIDSTGIFQYNAMAKTIFDEINGFFKDEDSLIAAQPDILRLFGGYLHNIFDGNSNGSNSGDSVIAPIAMTTKHTDPYSQKTSIVRNNKVGRNTGAQDATGSIDFKQYGEPADWRDDNIICGNTKQDGSPATIVQFNFLGTDYAIYTTECVGVEDPGPFYFRIKKRYRWKRAF